MSIVKDGGVLQDESDEDMQVFFSDPHFIHYAGMLSPPRPGVADCIQMLEHLHFAPGTPRNDLFIMRVIRWMDIVWAVVSIPLSDKHLMESVAQVNGLRASSGVPTMFADGGVYRFPIISDNLFVLVNVSGHPVYGGTPQKG